ncbi:MAG TPA: MBL fold metallo-hydrolase [Acidimicrobiales bacterium]|nr:MBL fold metallo-hydrolase [Acidimicrobiales bacterium]
MNARLGTEPSPLRQEPLEVAPETFLIRAVHRNLGGTVTTNMNSLVIRAAEPVIVDTGMVTDRVAWLEDVFSLVEPGRVRWIFLTHDDDDHTGNLSEALQLCRNATVVTSWAGRGRTCLAFDIPLERVRTVDDDGVLDVGDRTLRAIRPPVYDSAYTRGVFDPRTRVYFASDAFCAPMPPTPVDRVDELPPDSWAQGMVMFHHHSLAPWLAMVDERKYRREVEKLATVGAEVIVGSHTPVIAGPSIEQALAHLAALPSTVPPPLSSTTATVGARRPTD